MRLLLAVPPAAVLVASFFGGCSNPTACDGAAKALCLRAVACSQPGHAVFLSGSLPGMWAQVDYSTESSCEDLLTAKCPTGALTSQDQATFGACENTAPSSKCDQIVDPSTMKTLATGARMSAECDPLFRR